MSSIIQTKNLSNKSKAAELRLNPAVVKARLMQANKQTLVEQALLISEILGEEDLTANERQCLLSLYQFCKQLYKAKYQSG